MRVDELTLEGRRSMVAAWKKVNGRGLPKKSVRAALATEGLKRCASCWRDLEFAEFHKTGGYLQSHCKTCNRLNRREWGVENRDVVRESNSAYRAENPEAYWNHRVRYRCEKYGVPYEYVTFADLDENIRRHGWSPEHCFYCWTPLTGENRHREHIIPLSDPESPGGVLANTVNACASCNNRKRTTSAEEFVASRSGDSDEN